MNTSDVLNRAADLIEERGWTTIDNSTDPWGEDDAASPVCLEGAIFAAAGWDWHDDGDDDFRCPAFAAMHDYLRTGGHYRHGGAPRPYWFNDEDGRTAAEVIEVLRAAAVIEQARETERQAVSA